MMLSILNKVFDTLFPPRCPLCNRLVLKNLIPCDSCKPFLHELSVPAVCASLQSKYFDKCLSCFSYEGIVATNLKRYKYQGRLDKINFFVDAMFERINQFDSVDLIVPVPTGFFRILSRGYNQSALLSAGLSKKTGLKHCPNLLKKSGYRRAQVGLERDNRIANVKNSFSLSKRHRDMVSENNVLLIDDVLTTGATVNECAKVLKKAGAHTVSVLTVARTI